MRTKYDYYLLGLNSSFLVKKDNFSSESLERKPLFLSEGNRYLDRGEVAGSSPVGIITKTLAQQGFFTYPFADETFLS